MDADRSKVVLEQLATLVHEVRRIREGVARLVFWIITLPLILCGIIVALAALGVLTPTR